MIVKRIADLPNAGAIVDLLAELLPQISLLPESLEEEIVGSGQSEAWVLENIIRPRNIEWIERRAKEEPFNGDVTSALWLLRDECRSWERALLKKHGLHTLAADGGVDDRVDGPLEGGAVDLQLIDWAYRTYSERNDDERLTSGRIAGLKDTLHKFADRLEKAARLLLDEQLPDRVDVLNFNRLSDALAAYDRAAGAGSMDTVLRLLKTWASVARDAHRLHSKGGVTPRPLYLAVRDLMRLWQRHHDDEPARWVGSRNKPTSPAAKFVVAAMSLIDPRRPLPAICAAMRYVGQKEEVHPPVCGVIPGFDPD